MDDYVGIEYWEQNLKEWEQRIKDNPEAFETSYAVWLLCSTIVDDWRADRQAILEHFGISPIPMCCADENL